MQQNAGLMKTYGEKLDRLNVSTVHGILAKSLYHFYISCPEFYAKYFDHTLQLAPGEFPNWPLFKEAMQDIEYARTLDLDNQEFHLQLLEDAASTYNAFSKQGNFHIFWANERTIDRSVSYLDTDGVKAFLSETGNKFDADVLSRLFEKEAGTSVFYS